MVKVFIDFLEFLRTIAPFLTSLTIFTLLSILLAKSIKKHAKIYYIVLSIPFILVAIPTILGWCGIETFSFTRVPILGEILRDYIHMGSLGHPLLVIIMYMGALDTKKTYVKRLMSIRKELSIISGFPVLTHSLIRVANNFPNSLKYFTDHAEYMASPRVTSELGAGISSFSLVLGIILLAIFIPLWITSFDSIHKRMGNVKWKKFQKWSYVLYALLFIHAMGIQVGGMISRNAAPKTEVVAEVTQNRQIEKQKEAGNREKNVTQTQVKEQQPSHGGRPKVKGFSDFEVSGNVKRIISIISLLLVYGSYLFLRVRKAQKTKRKRNL